MARKLPYKIFRSIYSKVPRLCVELVIKDRRGVLMTLRAIKPAKGCWHLPGGTVLFQESIDDAVRRVAKEELNLNVSVKRLLAILEYRKTGSVLGHAVSLVFLVKPVRGKLKLDRQASKFGYFKKFPKKSLKEYKSLFRK